MISKRLQLKNQIDLLYLPHSLFHPFTLYHLYLHSKPYSYIILLTFIYQLISPSKLLSF